MHTEKEAVKLWCPMARYGLREGTVNYQTNEGALCMASGCAMWRWAQDRPLFSDEEQDRKGYCGLAGKPEHW